ALAGKCPTPEVTHVFSPTLVRRHAVSTPTDTGHLSTTE
ncbi:DNA-binding transcriptional regulator GalS, partial [Salmonella enterica subsp. enterica serovar Infantis]